jgi:hypothetical protein
MKFAAFPQCYVDDVVGNCITTLDPTPPSRQGATQRL